MPHQSLSAASKHELAALTLTLLLSVALMGATLSSVIAREGAAGGYSVAAAALASQRPAAASPSYVVSLQAQEGAAGRSVERRAGRAVILGGRAALPPSGEAGAASAPQLTFPCPSLMPACRTRRKQRASGTQTPRSCRRRPRGCAPAAPSRPSRRQPSRCGVLTHASTAAAACLPTRAGKPAPTAAARPLPLPNARVPRPTPAPHAGATARRRPLRTGRDRYLTGSGQRASAGTQRA